MTGNNSKPPRIRSKGLSCQRCRVRKVRCDGGSPCGGCVKESTQCIRVTFDRRKERILHEYVDELQNRIDHLEGIIGKVRGLVSIDGSNDKIVDSDSSKVQDDYDRNEDDRYNMNTNMNHSSTSGVYGPTSIFESSSIQLSNRDNEIKRLNYDPSILNCIKLFFIWQYPDHNMFIYREAFLLDFFNPKPGCIYCSLELIYAICAMGLSMSYDLSIKSKSRAYYQQARSLLLSKLDQTSIASMQALLCLSFYDISHGNNSSGWMLSGIAIRMGYDLGFQLNPNSWYINESITPLDCSIRSRIYWGFYAADHFISLLMGRPSSLKVSTSSIPETDELPDLEWIADYAYISPGVDKREIVYISAPLNSIIKLIQISESMINDIFGCITDKQEISKFILNSNKLEFFNSQIQNWKRDLPSDLKWNRRDLLQNADNPTTMSIRYYYYIVLLCLNRPFIEIMKNQSSISPMKICQDVIDDLLISIERFKQIHGLQKATIYIVYCCILSISVLMLTNGDRQVIDQILGYLKECSSTWKLAEKSYKMIKLRLDHQQAPQPEPVLTQSSSIHPNIMVNDIFEENLDYFAGPPMMMTAELFNDDWEVLFPDYHEKRNKED